MQLQSVGTSEFIPHHIQRTQWCVPRQGCKETANEEIDFSFGLLCSRQKLRNNSDAESHCSDVLLKNSVSRGLKLLQSSINSSPG